MLYNIMYSIQYQTKEEERGEMINGKSGVQAYSFEIC